MVARRRYLLRAVASMLTVVVLAVTVAPAESPCGSDCPCEGPPGAEYHGEEGVLEHPETAEASSEHGSDDHEGDEHEAEDPCDDDCPSCGGVAVALVLPALGMPLRFGIWRDLSVAGIPDTIHRGATSGVFRPPRRLG